ncbi:hypothetical protein ACFL36_01405 [Thermodesulfobacteriota bacterium]
MKQSALEKLKKEFHRWVNGYNHAKETDLDPDQLFGMLNDRIPEDRLLHVGAALLNGWLETEKNPMRRYFVRESDRSGERGGQVTITNYGGGLIAPWWELFVQLADYGWIRSVAERNGQEVRLEDRLMDITVNSGDQLILYIENKEKASSAVNLVKGMRDYGDRGFNLDDPDRNNDSLRKSKYIVKDNARPMFLGISAIGYKQLFKVEYSDGNRFRLIDDDRAFSAPLSEYPNLHRKSAPDRSPVDPLASEIETLCPEIWISVGSGKTEFNFYMQTTKGDVIIIGVYDAGELWTDVSGLGPDLADSFSNELSKFGIILETHKQWSFWKKGGSNYNLNTADPIAIASAVRSVLDQ